MTTARLCDYRYDALDQLIAHACAGQEPRQRFYSRQLLSTEIQGPRSESVFQQGRQLLALRTLERGAIGSRLLAVDQQRSVMHLTGLDGSGRLAYSPYGHRGEIRGFLAFTGEAPDAITGHYLLGNGYRAYNPVLMRFNSPDRLSPFGLGGLNTYAYCLGDPVNYSDPTGQFAPIARILTSIGTLFNSVITLRPGIPFQVALDALANGAVFRLPLRHSAGAMSAVTAGIAGVASATVGLASTVVAAVYPASALLVPLANTSLGLGAVSAAGRLGSWAAARNPQVVPALKGLAGGLPVMPPRRPSHIKLQDIRLPSSSFAPSAPAQTPVASAPPLSPGAVDHPARSSGNKRRSDGLPIREARKRIRTS